MTGLLHKAASRFSETAIDGEVVAMHLDSGVFYSLSGTAAAAWRLIDGTRNRETLVAALAQEFDADPEAIEADLAPFLTQLIEAGLVEST